MISRAIGFVSDGLSLAGQLVIPERPHLLVVLAHGLPSGHPADPADTGYEGLAHQIADRGHAAFWFNFRGVRESPGDLSIRGWVRDFEAALGALGRDRTCPPVPRVLVGSSAGGAITIAVGSRGRQGIAGVATLAAPAAFTFGGLTADPPALLATFRNIGLIRDPNFPADPDSWRGEFDDLAPERHIRDVAPTPLLIVHGGADDVVPYAHAERLFAAAGHPKELVHIPGGRHQLRRDPRAIDAIVDWMEHLPEPAS